MADEDISRRSDTGRALSIRDDRNLSEVALERRVAQPTFNIPGNGIHLFSPQWREMQRVIDEILGKSPWRAKFRSALLHPAEDAMLAGFNFFHDQFSAMGLATEAKLMSALINGFFGRTKKGDVVMNFRTFEGNPSGAARLMDEAGLIELPERLYSHGELMGLTVLDEAQSTIRSFKDVNPAGEKLLMETLYAKGEQLGKIMGAKYPGLNTQSGTRIMVANAGHHLGRMISRSEGIDKDGTIFMGGKQHSLATREGIEAMVDEAFESRYVIPSTNGKNVRARKALERKEVVGAGAGFDDDSGRTI